MLTCQSASARHCQLPKRVRCPNCDRLFSREEIDDHRFKCRPKEGASEAHRKQPDSRVIIVDGSNVAHYMEEAGKPMISNLALARRSLKLAGFEPIIVISAALVHQIDEPVDLLDMISTGQVIQVEKGSSDDREIIRRAKANNALVLSNDRFLDWLEANPWLSTRMVKYRMTPSGLILSGHPK